MSRGCLVSCSTKGDGGCGVGGFLLLDVEGVWGVGPVGVVAGGQRGRVRSSVVAVALGWVLWGAGVLAGGGGMLAVAAASFSIASLCLFILQETSLRLEFDTFMSPLISFLIEAKFSERELIPAKMVLRSSLEG